MKMVFLGLILFGAAYQDVRERKISNYFSVIGLLGILAFRYAEEAERGIFGMLRSWGISLLVFLPLFLIHAMGAGDIKLFSLVSALHGLKFAYQVCVLWFLLAGIVSLWKLLSERRLHQRMAYAWSYFITGRAVHMPYYDAKRDGTKDTIPLAPFLAAAYGVVQVGRWRGLW